MTGAAVDPLLWPWEVGSWAGLPLADLPDLTACRDDPADDGHGEESLFALLERARTLLQGWPGQSGRLPR